MKRHIYTVCLFLVTFLLIQTIFLFIIKYDSDIRTTKFHSSLNNSVLNQFHYKSNYMSETFIPLISDVKYLSTQRSFKHFLLNGKDSAFAIEDLINFSRSNSNYEQVRILDVKGNEVIRVNQNDSLISIVPKQYLQNKQHRDYFKKTLALSEGEVYISKLDLNMENGEVEIPFKPMIRVGTPITIKGRKQGVLIINYKAASFIKKLADSNSLNKGDFFLLNEQGSLITAPDSYEKFSSDRKEVDKDFKFYFPAIWNQINEKDEGSIISKNGYFSFTKVYPYKFSQGVEKKFSKNIIKDEVSWTMVFFLNENAFNEKMKIINEEPLKYLILSFLISLSAAFIVTFYRTKERNYLKTLSRLKDSLEEGFMTRTKELVQAKRQLELKIDDLNSSIRYAKKVQETILPEARLVKKYFLESFIYYRPKDIVAGDFYWMHSFSKTESFGEEKQYILFAVADCTGHGVPGAMVSLVCFNALNKAVKEEGIVTPSKILDRVADLVEEAFHKGDSNLHDGMDISICCLDTKENILQWAGANNPIWILRSSKILEYKPNRRPIGCCDPKIKNPFTLHEIKLEKGDIIYQFTDGIVDQFNGVTNKKLMKTGLKKLILKIGTLDSMDKQREELIAYANSWKGDIMQIDDICVVGLKIT